MAERKVLNKYFPPDFDPNFKQVDKAGGSAQHKVRLMAPFSMRCSTCGDYIYKGKKFNARKEIAWGFDYLDIKVYRFYIRCPRCAAEITFRTDPKNADYVAEHGISRNFEAWREEKNANEAQSYRKQMEEALDPMRKLENKTVDSKREIDILEALDEVRTRNARFEKIDIDSALDFVVDLDKKEQEQLVADKQKIDDEDTRVAREYFNSTDKVENVIIRKRLVENVNDTSSSVSAMPPLKKIQVATLDKASLGIVKKSAVGSIVKKPVALVAQYDSDSE